MIAQLAKGNSAGHSPTPRYHLILLLVQALPYYKARARKLKDKMVHNPEVTCRLHRCMIYLIGSIALRFSNCVSQSPSGLQSDFWTRKLQHLFPSSERGCEPTCPGSDFQLHTPFYPCSRRTANQKLGCKLLEGCDPQLEKCCTRQSYGPWCYPVKSHSHLNVFLAKCSSVECWWEIHLHFLSASPQASPLDACLSVICDWQEHF